MSNYVLSGKHLNLNSSVEKAGALSEAGPQRMVAFSVRERLKIRRDLRLLGRAFSLRPGVHGLGFDLAALREEEAKTK